ncbi:MAG: Cupredoxin-like domain [Frankiaceae bacterium]|jgi:plastocyanin|nr:Cupredoxin-like domain [Frankiaceae bacterium]
MRRRVVPSALPVALLLALSPALPAQAEVPQNVVAAVAIRYLPVQVTIDQGETLDLVNLDPTSHDVVAHDLGADGQPVFRSAIVGAGGQARVVGVESLLPSAYPFVCSVHDSMTGVLIVQ